MQEGFNSVFLLHKYPDWRCLLFVLSHFPKLTKKGGKKKKKNSDHPRDDTTDDVRSLGRERLFIPVSGVHSRPIGSCVDP